MAEYLFEFGVTLVLPDGLVLVDVTTLQDPYPRKLVAVDYETLPHRQTYANTVGDESA